MNYKSILAGVLLALGLGTAVSAADVKVGFVYVGPIGDGGWTYEHDKGRLAVEKHFGDRVETIYQESVPEGADSERVMIYGYARGGSYIHHLLWIHGPYHKCCKKISKRKI